MVRAFYSTKSVALGEVDLVLEIGPCQFEVPVVVIDILTIFNMLLDPHCRRNPIQFTSKVKFIRGNKLITIMAEKEILL